MGCLTIVRAIVVRMLFACHGLISLWRLYDVTKDLRFWYLAVTLVGLSFETAITVFKKDGKEWKWFCPSVFIYLLSVVPAIWFLELYEMEKRIQKDINSTLSAFNESTHDLHAHLGRFLGMKFEIHIPLRLSSDQWIRTLEQFLLLLLILGRWLLPKGKLTHDQLSQLLLVYIGTAADIVEFFDAFKEKEVRYNKLLCIIILSIWSMSLIQFSLVLTASSARHDQSGLVSQERTSRLKNCCQADVYGIMISIFLQDGPFLALRLMLIFKYKVDSYTNIFFTSKNSLVIILLIYRLVVVQIEMRKSNSPKISLPIHANRKYQTVRAIHETETNFPTQRNMLPMTQSPSKPNGGIRGREFYRTHQLSQPALNSSSHQLLPVYQQQQPSSLPHLSSRKGKAHMSHSSLHSSHSNQHLTQKPLFPPNQNKMTRSMTTDRINSPV
ncbi:transmembrane protein 26-like isoform X1 [Octopus sinensis]|uniref:Transmembrane protein 26-like isoform X1 n=2 Tax=Octopus sinensis TaxID=2607531 RepID=A0A6P7TR65_9MOLL|nr:transmembrane protein 26-like isoform X1 [Octopus sinensis]